jgi:2-keto-3-deoxy-L-rhamnonate aldolase RhmA
MRLETDMELMLITNNAEIAMYAERSGVDRVMVDLEILGKEDRQGHLDTVISEHSIDDILDIRNAISKSKLVVRVNPIHDDSINEIDEVVNRGSDAVMLPMFKTVDEVEKFIHFLNGKANSILLLETPQALVRIDEILLVPQIDEIYIGLNDLHLGMGLDFMFELLSGGIVEYLSEKIKSAGIKFGFGGIARLGHGKLDSSLILSEHHRIGSQIVILSRDFHGGAKNLSELMKNIDLEFEVNKIRNFIRSLDSSTEGQQMENKKRLSKFVKDIVSG